MADLVGKTVRLPPELWEMLAERAKKTERSVNYEIIQAVRSHVVKSVPGVGKVVSSQYQDGTKVVLPLPRATRAGTDSGEKKEEKRRSRGGSVRGEQATLDGTDPPPFTEPVVVRIIEHLNDTCEVDFETTAPPFRALILKLLAEGYEEDHFQLVHEWANQNWVHPKSGEKDWRAIMVVPAKLYGDKFSEHLGVARGWKKRQAEEAKPWRPPEDQIHYPGKF